MSKDGGGEEEIEAENTLLAMGSVPIELPFLPFDGKHIVTSTEALAFDRVPEHLVVVGAGAVGLELGSVWHRLGAQVTVIEMLPTIVPFADRQVAKALEKSLTKQGLAFRLKSKVVGATDRRGHDHALRSRTRRTRANPSRATSSSSRSAGSR